jgi:glycerol-3-phosphate dehydrogenase
MCRWLADRMGARPATLSGLSGIGDIMLTCYGSLSRNRSVGIRLGKGEQLKDILASSTQVCTAPSQCTAHRQASCTAALCFTASACPSICFLAPWVGLRTSSC